MRVTAKACLQISQHWHHPTSHLTAHPSAPHGTWICQKALQRCSRIARSCMCPCQQVRQLLLSNLCVKLS